MKVIIIGRYINGVSLNGLEYLLNPDGTEVRFKSVDQAKQYLLDNGVSEADVDECFVFQELRSMGRKMVAVDIT